MNWERVRLGDVCKIDNGYAFKSKNYVSDKGARIIRITNVQKGKVVDNDPKLYPFEMLAGLERYEIFENDIMMSLTGNVGRVGRFPKEMLPAYINQRVCRIKSIDKKLDETYLFHFLNSDIFEREAIYASAGIAQLNLSTNWVADYIIPLPPMSVQKEIVEKLDKAVVIREKSKALLSRYDALAESLFIELFGDPISNEKGWEKKKLGEVVTNLNNMRVPLKSSDRQMLVNKYPYYGASGIIDYVDDFIYEGDNLLIGEDGANLLSRSTPIAFIAKGKYWVNNHAHVNGYNGKANLLYLCFFINMIDLSPYVTGSAQPKLNRGNLDNIEIPLPPLSLQVKFAEMVENIEEQKAKAKAEIEQSEAVFQALLQESFG